ncbi:MAG: leucine-rich repeat domain-containing protein [Prevotellaceae bacterium]|jgi:hypothetical protein|nr:leucine-rich repeat domain-containing protein [Prevotellaceae bacterium]
MNKTAILFLVFAALYLSSCSKDEPAQTVDSGVCGTNLTWTLTDDGVLTISGEGEMTDYDYYDNTPWSKYLPEIKTILMKEGVTTIGSYAFKSCTGLSSVSISGSVTTIRTAAFFECIRLSFVAIPGSVTTIGMGAFYNCTSLSSITIPNNIRRIESDTFAKCSGLSSVIIPNSVATIGSSAFIECTGLSSVTISGNATIIGNYAFAGCEKLATVTNLSPVPQAMDFVLYKVNTKAATLYVPAASLEAYKTAPVWREFGTILPIN